MSNPLVSIVIPTFNRQAKLERCLRSIYKQNYPNYQVYIFCDNKDEKSYQYFSQFSKVQVYLNEQQLYAPGCWNKFNQLTFKDNFFNAPDIVMWLVDDAEVKLDTLSNGVASMIANYPNLDGVIGLSQELPDYPNYTFKPYGQVLIGKNFILDNYKQVDYNVSCPQYKFLHQDEELFLFASSINKFTYCKEATIIHHHPAFEKTELDETHLLSRKNEIRTKDRDTWTARQNKGYVWGKSFETI